MCGATYRRCAGLVTSIGIHLRWVQPREILYMFNYMNLWSLTSHWPRHTVQCTLYWWQCTCTSTSKASAFTMCNFHWSDPTKCTAMLCDVYRSVLYYLALLLTSTALLRYTILIYAYYVGIMLEAIFCSTTQPSTWPNATAHTAAAAVQSYWCCLCLQGQLQPLALLLLRSFINFNMWLYHHHYCIRAGTSISAAATSGSDRMCHHEYYIAVLRTTTALSTEYCCSAFTRELHVACAPAMNSATSCEVWQLCP
jgi:hypothetical protein